VNDPDPTNNSASASGTASVITDLSITKTDGRTTAVPGQRLTYTITVTNGGPSPVVGATVIDLQPPGFGGVTWFCTTTPGGSCALASGTGNVDTTVDLPNGGVATIIVTGVVSPDAEGIFTNSASVQPPPGATDPDTSNNTTADPTLLTPLADLSIGKTGTTSATPGSTVTYTLVVTSTGPSTATDVTVTDPTPPGLAFVGNAGDCATAFPCSLGSLEPGASRIIVSTYTALAGSMAVNTAMVASSTVDPDIDNNSSTAMTELVTVADLALTKTGPATAPVGGTATYTLTVRNNGPDASIATLSDSLPAGVELVSVTPTQGTCTGTTGITCTLGNISAHATATVTVTVRILGTAPDSLVNSASVASSTLDSNPANNVASATTAVDRRADLSLSKTVSPEKIEVGQGLTYVVTVTNSGPGPATNVTLTDALPAAVTPGSVTASQGSCALAAGTVTCALGNLAVNAAATVTITATRAATEAFSNTATVTATEPDPNQSNNTATATTTNTTPEDCTNCVDDNGNGLVDAEDPECCTPESLTFTKGQLQVRRSRVRLRATLAQGAFVGVDPRKEDVHLQVRDQNGEAVCCTIPQGSWVKVLGRTFWFRDKTMSICPPIQAACLTRPTKGHIKTTIIAGRQTPTSGLGSPLEITLSVGSQCVQGSLSLRPRPHGGAVFP
jgi:uncharacterized repeat protein (TIGR01451 family)